MKANILRKFIEQSGEDLDLILNKYANEYFVDKQNKKEIFKDIVNGNPSPKTMQYLDNRLGEKKFNFLRDRRTPTEYGQDLILGWIAEDVCLQAFRKIGLFVSLQGADKEREFLRPQDIKTNADLSVTIFQNLVGALPPRDLPRDHFSSAPQRRIEFVYDAKLFWKKKNACHLRGNKFNKLKKENAIIFGISLVDKEAFYIDLKNIFEQEDLIEIKYIDKHFPFGKSVYEIFGIKNLLGDWKEKLLDLKNHIFSDKEAIMHN